MVNFEQISTFIENGQKLFTSISGEAWFSRIIDILGLLTIYAAFKSLRASRRSNELQLLPIIRIEVTGNSIKNAIIKIKNIGKSPAYNIKIESFSYITVDNQTEDKIDFIINGTNIIAPNEEREVDTFSTRNGERNQDIDEFLRFILNPNIPKDSDKTYRLIISYRNVEWKKYVYVMEINDKEGLVIKPIKHIKLFSKAWNDFKTRIYLKIKWGLFLPHIASIEKPKLRLVDFLEKQLNEISKNKKRL